ncbi:MAG TPA: DHHA1 domain-containing protein, partial [Blastocatellia bacterium]|nr:DHHA1 domain-containing protein [Blastocatellia bacterium]
AGGQVGDTGTVEGEHGLAMVEDCYAPVMGYNYHKVKIERGKISVGDLVDCHVDAELRRRTKANHSGTHLLHAALREVLGPHVKQGGSLVAPDRLRFDFTHYAALSEEEIAEIERLVNDQILHNRGVQTEIKPVDEAIKAGAMALFGEKYGNQVRVVSVPGFSVELCGGTHVHATGDIGPFKIISDSALAAGVRRVEAVTADDAIARFQADERIIKRLNETLRAKLEDIPAHVDKLQDLTRKQQREIEELKLKIAMGNGGGAGAADDVKEVAGVKVLARRVEDLDANAMRQLADTLSSKIKPGVVVLGQASDGKASLIVRVTDDLTGRLNAGQIVKEISALIGGKGGGKADMASGGGTQPEKLDEALAQAGDTVGNLMGGK